MKKRILVAMSGGIDSSIAAILLLKQGYELVGVTFRSWDYVSEACMEKRTGCCDADSLFEAKAFAEKLGFEHHILDIRENFKNSVIKNFVDEYLAGRTPNPCVVCNSHIKWGQIIEFADQLNCEKIATGHYARINYINNRYFISKGKDPNKDQSYFLWNLTQNNLKRTIFPLGEMTKDQVREIAKNHGFKTLSEKSESQEICFIPDNDYRRFLKENVENIGQKYKGGDFVLVDGTFLGKHKGFPFYTIGQRKGLEVAVGYPLYVLHIDAKTNTITLGRKEELEATRMVVENISLSKYENIPESFNCETKIRYRSAPVNTIINQVGNKLEVDFLSPVSAITPGQSAVFYEGEDLIGGGIISSQ